MPIPVITTVHNGPLQHVLECVANQTIRLQVVGAGLYWLEMNGRVDLR